MSFVPGPYVVQPVSDDWQGYENWKTFSVRHSTTNVCLAVVGEVDRYYEKDYEATANLLAAAPELYAAVDAADTAFAVLQISDLTPQARGCIREAWPLIQQARAKVDPSGVYAEAIRESHQHEIARLDAIIAEVKDILANAPVQTEAIGRARGVLGV